jgi:hypothetical protein
MTAKVRLINNPTKEEALMYNSVVRRKKSLKKI